MKEGQLPPTDGWVSGRDSEKVVTILFKNRQEPRTFYSRDWKNEYAPYDTKLGTKRLIENVIDRHLKNSIQLFYSYNDSENPKERTLIKFYQNGDELEITPELLEILRS